MSYPLRYAVLMDGAFLIRKLERRLKAFPSVQNIESVAASIANHECVAGLSRLRVYFYHARPADELMTNPISKIPLRLSSTSVHARHRGLLQGLATCPDFALRLGETVTRGWRLGAKSFETLVRAPRTLEARDLVPIIEQKGVDLRIGLDIARLALTHAVQAIVVVTGDSDLVPAFKFARREGIRVFLCYLNHGIRRELREHADRVVEISHVPLATNHCRTSSVA
jgi:uncharacterized LabA/DUF88 family protein